MLETSIFSVSHDVFCPSRKNFQFLACLPILYTDVFSLLVTEHSLFAYERIENIDGEGEYAGYHCCLFSTRKKENNDKQHILIVFRLLQGCSNPGISEPCSVKRGLNSSAKRIDSCQPMQSVKANKSRKCLLLVKFLNC